MTAFATGPGGLLVILAAIAVAIGVDWARQGIAGREGGGLETATRSARRRVRAGTVLALVLAVLGAALTLVRFAELALT